MLLSEGDGPMKGYNYPAFTSDLGDPGDQLHHVVEGAQGGQGDARGLAGPLLGGPEAGLEGAAALQDHVRPHRRTEK